MDKEYLWSWHKQEKAIQNKVKIGDTVNVGYIKDCDKYNYTMAKIVDIKHIPFYPDGTDKSKILRHQIYLEFFDGYVGMW